MNQLSEYIESMNKMIPEFKSHWDSDESSFNFGPESTIHGVFSEFSHFVTSALEKNELSNVEEIFKYIEVIVTNGGEASNAACTCFLENIINRTPDDLSPNSFTPYLGVNSKEFYKKYKNAQA